MKQIAARALAVAAVALAAGCTGRSATHSTTPPTAGSSTTVPGTRPSLSATLALTATTVKAGGQLSGQVVVENDTGHALRVTGCGSIFQVLLTSGTYEPTPVWPTCVQIITIPKGRSAYRVSVATTYFACSQRGPSGTLPACTATGSSPVLPPGPYEARTFESGDAVPLPQLVDVRVTS